MRVAVCNPAQMPLVSMAVKNERSDTSGTLHMSRQKSVTLRTVLAVHMAALARGTLNCGRRWCRLLFHFRHRRAVGNRAHLHVGEIVVPLRSAGLPVDLKIE